MRLLQLLFLLAVSTIVQAQEAGEPVTIYPAQRILTMDPERPVATAIALAGERIVAVGDLPLVVAQTEALDQTIDERFSEQVLLPGFILPNVHTAFAALLATSAIVSTEPWQLGDASWSAARSHIEYLFQLSAALARDARAELLFSWGYHAEFHGQISRVQLDLMSNELPMLLWQRSSQSLILNTPALEASGINEAALSALTGELQAAVLLAEGRIEEQALADFALPKLLPLLLAGNRMQRGLQALRAYLHSGGVTVVAESQVIGDDNAAKQVASFWENPNIPIKKYSMNKSTGAAVSPTMSAARPTLPLRPLQQAWLAMTQPAEEQRLSIEQALRTMTLDAAKALQLDDRMGSLAVGKLANITVLAQDPLTVETDQLPEIPVLGTVLQGRLHLLPN